MWSAPNKTALTQRILNEPLPQAIHFAQRSTLIYFHRKAESVEGGLVAEEQVNYLQSIGFDLDGASATVKESDLTDPEQLIYYHDRPISTDLLYRLCICQQFREVLDRTNPVILEIGAGLGTLARTVKLLNSSTRYIIIDLLDTLVLSYGFLRANFPDASVTFVADSAQLEQLDTNADFTFIPAVLAHDIPRLDVDLVVNTHSLGEMRQETVEQYIDLVENRLNVKRFFSLNRYLQPERIAAARDESYQASYSTPLGPHWDVVHWEFCPAFVRQNRYDLDVETTLELYVQRVNPDSTNADNLRQRSDEMLAEARRMGNFRGHRWHRLMWDSIRLCPRKENVEPYYQFLKASNCREYRYFGRMLASYGVEVDEPYTRPTLKRGLRTKSASALYRLAKRINPGI
jgi:putative sugar O-methyltransferase